METFKVYPSKSRFKSTEDITLIIKNETNVDITINIFHFGELIYSFDHYMNSSVEHITLPYRFDFHSYGIQCIVDGEEYYTAFEIYDDWKMIPRYGFLSDFYTNSIKDHDFLDAFLQLHINVVQYYDWMYKHENLISPMDTFTDLMGRKLNQRVVKNRIELCKNHGIKNIAYGAIYGASNEFYMTHHDWAFFGSQGEAIRFIDVFTIMNFTDRTKWQPHIINEYKKAISVMGFDGIHLDTYGYPKIAKDFQGKTIYLDEQLVPFIHNVKEGLKAENLENELIFNNVGGWPIYETYKSDVSALYVEIWDPISSYEDIMTLVRNIQSLDANKQLIIAAYLKPYFEQQHSGAVIAHQILYALLGALGAHHLIMGENKKVLRTGYYCDYGTLSESEFEIIKQYYDFNAEFSEFLYDTSLRDVSLTHSYGDNIEYILDPRCDVHANVGKICTILKENKQNKFIHLVNLMNQETNLWNENKVNPQNQKNLEIQVLAEYEVETILQVSPNHKKTQLPFESTYTNRGINIRFIIPEIELWDVIIIKQKVQNNEN